MKGRREGIKFWGRGASTRHYKSGEICVFLSYNAGRGKEKTEGAKKAAKKGEKFLNSKGISGHEYEGATKPRKPEPQNDNNTLKRKTK